jgi:hypothetical protein
MTRCVFLCSNMESGKQIQINLHPPGFAYGFHGIQLLFDIVLYFELSLMRLRYMWLVNPHLTLKPYWWLMVMHIYMIYFYCLGHWMQDICLISPYTAFDLFFLTRLTLNWYGNSQTFFFKRMNVAFINTPCGMEHWL